jgi:cytochrome c-type biogenesis protein CcmE
MRVIVVAISFAVISIPIVIAQPADANDIPSDALLLIHSELDYLEVADREISLTLDRANPHHAIKQIATTAGLSIEVDGILPMEPTLTKSFENSTVKDVLTWYASEVKVMYKAISPDRLVIIAHGDMRRDKIGAS